MGSGEDEPACGWFIWANENERENQTGTPFQAGSVWSIELQNGFYDYMVFANPLTWILLITLIGSIVLQVNYLNKSLDMFNTQMVYPIYYVLFTSVVLCTSIILFQKWSSMSPVDVVTTVGSFMVIVVGVAMLHLFREHTEVHIHKFLLKIHQTEEKILIYCDHPQTVLEVITSKPELQEKIKSGEGKVTLLKGEADQDTAIATHFPCTLLRDGELVTLIEEKELMEVGDKGRFDYSVSKDMHYYVVHIKTEGGRNTKLCVYGTGDMTLKDAIERDGRFAEFGDFKLEYDDKERVTVLRSDKMKHHDGQTFRISIDRNTPTKANESPAKENREIFPKEACEAAFKSTGEKEDGGAETPLSIEELAAPRVIPGEPAGGSQELNKVVRHLCDQFPEFEEASLGDNLNEILEKVDMSKAQQTFSEMYRLEKLFKLGRSVCKIKVGSTYCGTGFVLLKRYVLTNAHLFDPVLYNDNVLPHIRMTAVFERPDQENIEFEVCNVFIDYDRDMDYAVLELVVSEEEESDVPQGLMKYSCAMPESGEACLIGHPHGEVIQVDPTCMIEKRKREHEVNEHLHQYKDDTMIAFKSIRDDIKRQGIDRVISPFGSEYHKWGSYHTYMDRGSSGSPVFDGECKVFGMHTAGFTFTLGQKKGSVIEIARPILLILNRFVANLRNRDNTDLLRAVEEELMGNKYRKEILGSEEPMEES